MKKNISIVIGIMLASFVTLFAQTKQTQVTVSGLACPVCSYGLEKKLKQIDGIENLKIDLKTGLVTFTMKEGKTVSDEVIRQKVKEAGYTVKEIKYVDLPEKPKNK